METGVDIGNAWAGKPSRSAVTRLNLRVRLGLRISSLLALVMLASTVLAVRDARTGVRAEVESTAGLAAHLLDAEIARFTGAYAGLSGADPARSPVFHLKALATVQHLRIEFRDASGRLRDSNRGDSPSLEPAPPMWFVKLLGEPEASLPTIRRPVFANGLMIGELILQPDPDFELARVWSDASSLLLQAAILFVAINLLVHWTVGRALQPVDRILSALNELQRGRLGVRLPNFAVREMSAIATRFNAMAEALQTSNDRGRMLTQRIVNLQEIERKALARDLHDEFGQSLTAISIDVAAIQQSTTLEVAHHSAQAIGAVCRHLIARVHGLLQQLRPETLDTLGLPAALRDLVQQWRQRAPQVTISAEFENLQGISFREDTTVTLYRTAQECLTNALRHAKPRSISLSLARHAEQIALTVRDDGVGFNVPAAGPGWGLAGMRERAEGLGGQLTVSSFPGKGTTVTIVLPMLPSPAD